MASTSSHRFADSAAPDAARSAHTAGSAPGSGATSQERGPAAVSKLREQIEELKQYAAYYAQARLDALKLSVRQAVLYAALALVAVMICAALLCAAAVLLLVGVADGLGQLLDRAWLGNLITGFTVIVLALLGAWITVRRLIGGAHSRLRVKYERLREQQRAQFGHDIHDRPGAAQVHAQRD